VSERVVHHLLTEGVCSPIRPSSMRLFTTTKDGKPLGFHRTNCVKFFTISMTIG